MTDRIRPPGPRTPRSGRPSLIDEIESTPEGLAAMDAARAALRAESAYPHCEHCLLRYDDDDVPSCEDGTHRVGCPESGCFAQERETP